MGGCATKPKVLKEAQAPGPEKEEKAGAAAVLAKTEKYQPPDHVVLFSVTEAENTDKKKELDGHDKVKESEIVDDDRVDEQEISKRRSLSHLFKETPVPDFAAQKPETPLELTSVSDVVDAPENAKTKELTTETAPAADTKTDGKQTEDADHVDDALRKVETEKVVEATPAVETKTLDVPSTAQEKAKTQRPIETAVGTEAHEDDKSHEEKKAEEFKREYLKESQRVMEDI
ncbi:hypothetical protein I3843_04G077400 [Carya illinoinensis]|nr:hypothetical protein I3843_04G077400 [Carya illinoinensis]